MLHNVLKYVEIAEKAFEISKEFLLDNSLQQVTKDKLSLVSELQEETGIKVPIVGDFSAGKSSLVNCLLGRNGLLPVDITPETAVAYEIYYSPVEVVELFRDGLKIEEEDIGSIKHLSVKPGDVAKVYVNSPIIREYQEKGIIIVDMPGIDSGIKEHNDAILHYINKGTVFILLTDSESGSLRESTISFITELGKYNLKPAVIISKIDKKPESEIAEIKEYVEFQAKRALGEETFVGCVSSADGNISDFTNFVASLDSNSLVSEKYVSKISSFINMQISTISAQKDILLADIRDVDEKINKLEEEKVRLSAQLSESIPYADTPEKSAQDILDSVKIELHSHSEDIATKVVNKEDSNTINAMIMNYIRPVIINAFKEEGEQYAAAMNTVVDDVSRALQDALSIDGNFVDNIVENMRGEIVGGVQLAAEYIKSLGTLGKVFGWCLSFFGEKIPDLIRWFFGKSKETIIAEASDMIRTSVIDQISEQLRPVILEQVRDQQNRIRENIRHKIAISISNLQESVEASACSESKENLSGKVESMNEAIARLSKLNESI